MVLSGVFFLFRLLLNIFYLSFNIKYKQKYQAQWEIFRWNSHLVTLVQCLKSFGAFFTFLKFCTFWQMHLDCSLIGPKMLGWLIDCQRVFKISFFISKFSRHELDIQFSFSYHTVFILINSCPNEHAWVPSSNYLGQFDKDQLQKCVRFWKITKKWQFTIICNNFPKNNLLLMQL